MIERIEIIEQKSAVGFGTIFKLGGFDQQRIPKNSVGTISNGEPKKRQVQRKRREKPKFEINISGLPGMFPTVDLCIFKDGACAILLDLPVPTSVVIRHLFVESCRAAPRPHAATRRRVCRILPRDKQPKKNT